MKKLPLLQWSLDIIAVLLMSLVLGDWWGLFSWNDITLFCFVGLFFCLAMRKAILYPRKHKIIWIFFTIIGLLVLLYYSPHMLNISETNWTRFAGEFVLLMFFAFPSTIFFFLNRSENKQPIKRHDAYFYMGLSSIMYAYPLCYGLFYSNRELPFLIPLLFFPLFWASLLVWIGRGFGPGGIALSFVLIPIFLVVSTFVLSMGLPKFLFIVLYILFIVFLMLSLKFYQKNSKNKH